MHTHLPYPSFADSAKALDRLRLSKQRLDVLHVYRACFDPSADLATHPVVRMWKGHEGALLMFGIAICDEWTGRGNLDEVKDKFVALLPRHTDFTLPRWFGDPEFHRSHRSKLLQKNPEYYRDLWFEVALPYVWPEP